MGRLVTQASKADRRGRRLDDAWQHAKPLDLLRQKAECRYCGFSSSHGGISRLKAHLGGGNPGTRLPGCDKVPPEVKRVMAEWFSEWIKNTKSLWTKDIRGRPQDRYNSINFPPQSRIMNIFAKEIHYVI